MDGEIAMNSLSVRLGLPDNYCSHCKAKLNFQIRKLLLFCSEARCLCCGYMLVPKITSLLPLKFLTAILLAATVRWLLLASFPATPDFFVLIVTIIAAYLAFRICDCFSQLKAFDV